MSQYLFKNGHLIDPVTGIDGLRDILVDDGTISMVRESIPAGNAEVIDLTGAVVAPGFCDMHVHFRDPGQEHKETLSTGALSAAAGGYTAVACMPNTVPAIDTAEVVSAILRKSETFPVDIYPIGAITKGREGKELAPMAELHTAGAVGFSDDGSCVHDTKLLRIALEYASMFDVPVIQHAEDIEQGGLAGAGGPHDGEEIALVHG